MSVQVAFSSTLICRLRPLPLPWLLFSTIILFFSSGSICSHSCDLCILAYHCCKDRLLLKQALQRLCFDLFPKEWLSASGTISSHSIHLGYSLAHLTRTAGCPVAVPLLRSKIETAKQIQIVLSFQGKHHILPRISTESEGVSFCCGPRPA